MAKLIDYLEEVYSSAADNILSVINETLIHSPRYIAPTKNKNWFKSINLYCVYADGIRYDSKLSPLKNLALHIPHIIDLGCNAIHILPFLKSPLVDKGFDISDHYAVQPELGTLADLLAVKKLADEAGMQVFMDMVVNHVSDQHEWFIRAQQGDAKYRNYFLHVKEKPHFIRKYTQESAVWAEYKVEGRIIKLVIAFPDHSGPLPHWREGSDGYWYYHSYFPQQLDLNWLNPDVFIEMAKILIYWGSYGFHFRIDAILNMGKPAYKTIDMDNRNTHLLTAALKELCDHINPDANFLAESFEDMQAVIAYFGNDDQVQANLSYNFHLCTNVWLSLYKENYQFIWRTLDAQKELPQHAAWLNFLRNHDELSLAHIADDIREDFYQAIVPYGGDFREGCGVSGRTFSMLQNNVKRFTLAYFLLASLPGSLMLPYGDEIGFKNIPLSVLTAAEQADTRNINRGIIQAEDFNNVTAKQQFAVVKQILSNRQHIAEFLVTWPEQVAAPTPVFAARYHGVLSRLLVYVNLSAKAIQLPTEPGQHQVLHVNDVSYEDGYLVLGPYAGVWLVTTTS